MPKTTALYAEMLAIVAVVAVVVHFATSLDWPWAIVVGAAVFLIARAVFHRRPAARP